MALEFRAVIQKIEDILEEVQHAISQDPKSTYAICSIRELSLCPPVYENPILYAMFHLYIAVNLPCTHANGCAAKEHYIRQASILLDDFIYNRMHDDQCQDCLMLQSRKDSNMEMDKEFASDCVLYKTLSLVLEKERIFVDEFKQSTFMHEFNQTVY